MATKAAAAPAAGTEIQIMELKTGRVDMCILGTTPLILNRMSQKVWQELLAPKGRKTTIEKASSLKHDPIQEFRNSPYIMQDPNSSTLFGVMASGFKKAMGTAALEIPGAKKAQIGRLVYVPGQYVEVFGLPQIFMSITRSADMNKTPDVRTRAILPKWACRISIEFVKPALREQAMWNLMAAAGIVSGIGDWRQEKGSGNFGSFRVCDPEDPQFLEIIDTMGRATQAEAYNNPQPYDDETSEILAWYEPEMKKRGFATTGRDGEILSPAVEKTGSNLSGLVVAAEATPVKSRKSKGNGAAAH